MWKGSVLLLAAVTTLAGCSKDPCGEGTPRAAEQPAGAWAKIGYPEGATMCQPSYLTTAEAIFESPEAAMPNAPEARHRAPPSPKRPEG